jgi:hypothetical protein
MSLDVSVAVAPADICAGTCATYLAARRTSSASCLHFDNDIKALLCLIINSAALTKEGALF